MKSTLAKTGPLADMEACTRWGYLERTQAARLPGYEPPKAIHLVPAGKLCFVFIAVIKYAMSARACSLERYFRFSTLRSLNNIIKIYPTIVQLFNNCTGHHEKSCDLWKVRRGNDTFSLSLSVKLPALNYPMLKNKEVHPVRLCHIPLSSLLVMARQFLGFRDWKLPLM